MIGGNIKAEIQRRTTEKNDIGEFVESWQTVVIVNGWLDLINGDSHHGNYNAKVQESTHVFICNYDSAVASTESEASRAVINGKIYDIQLIDDPMGLHQHFELYLRYVGGATL